MIRTAEDEKVVGLQRVAEPEDDDELLDADGDVAAELEDEIITDSDGAQATPDTDDGVEDNA